LRKLKSHAVWGLDCRKVIAICKFYLFRNAELQMEKSVGTSARDAVDLYIYF